MIKKIFLLALIALPHQLYAHQAHSHTDGRASLALDKAEGVFDLELPATALIDFEHKPKNPVQKIKLQKALQTLESSTSEVLVIDSAFGCSISKSKAEVLYSGKNDSLSEFKLSSQLKCLKMPSLSAIKLKILKKYPKLDKIEVQVLLGDLQKSFVLKGQEDSLN